MKPVFIEIKYDGEIYLRNPPEQQYRAIWNLQGLKCVIASDHPHKNKEGEVHMVSYRLSIHYKHNLVKTLCWKSSERRDEVYMEISSLLLGQQ